ncbi:J domain-containing protein [Microbulbifer pacificus]|uniref:J domain-containing protein n=1 Tax=Microbulbifer pacificus TaxID=407164 RepID=A0AAU0MW85_9GAMM|nr:J domain-containing protein [Microbulbifer pacificus]WOX04397.1 J domain-containing protein [Microbulbifer pacificus]
MTNCWDVLELTHDSDRTQVRRAYARLIKQFRPDESPLEFQKIHDAYEEALNWLRYPEAVRQTLSGHEEAVDGESEQVSGQDGMRELAEGFLPPGMTQEIIGRINEAIAGLADSEMMVEVDGFRISRGEMPEQGFRVERIYSPENDECRDNLGEDYRNALDEALATVDEILEKPDRANAKYWDFLADCPFLLDQEFRFHLTGNLLRKIARFNLSRKGASEAPVGVTAMQTLDRYLNFSGLSHEDFYQLSEREWFALRMPDQTLSASSVGMAEHGLKGGKLLKGKSLPDLSERSGSFWVDLGKFAVFGAVMAAVILGAIVLVSMGKGLLLYGFVAIGAIKFFAALFWGEHEKL